MFIRVHHYMYTPLYTIGNLNGKVDLCMSILTHSHTHTHTQLHFSTSVYRHAHTHKYIFHGY